MPSLTQLEYILAVEKTGHFGNAAKQCYVSQPSLSAQIQKLEDELQVIIFDRTKKPILTTEEGQEILQQARIVIREYKKLEAIASNAQKEVKGEFRLGIIPTLASSIIPLFIKNFHENYPQVHLKINEHKTEDIINLLDSDSLDAGILVTPLENDHIIERHLFFEPFCVYSSSEHEFANKKSIKETDLVQEGLWLLEEGHCFREQVLKVCARRKKNRTFSNIEFASGSLETLKNLVRKNAGFTLLPELATLEMPAQEVDNHVRKFRGTIPTREVSIVHGRSFYKEKIISALETSILEELPSQFKSLKKKNIEIVPII